MVVVFLQSVVIERFHKVARLHWSTTETRAGAHGEGACEFSGWEEPLVLRQATRLFKKCTNSFSYPPPPKKKTKENKKKNKKPHKINLRKKKVDIKKIKMFFHARIFCIAQPTYSKALFPFVTGVHAICEVLQCSGTLRVPSRMEKWRGRCVCLPLLCKCPVTPGVSEGHLSVMIECPEWLSFQSSYVVCVWV